MQVGTEGEKLSNWPFLDSGQGRKVGSLTSWALKRWGILPTLRQPHPQRPMGLLSQSSPLEPRRPRLLQPAPQSFPQQRQHPSASSGWIHSLCPHAQLTAAGCSFPEKEEDTIPLQELNSILAASPEKISQESPTSDRPGCWVGVRVFLKGSHPPIP